MLENLATRFDALYRGLQRAHGCYTVTGADPVKKGKKTGKAVTLYEKPDLLKWVAHLEGSIGLGIVPINEQNLCRWGAIDIDEYTAGKVETVEEQTRKLKLPVICIRTKSGGVHVTAYVSEPILAKQMRAKMMEFAAALGVAGVEIYPKQVVLAGERDCGNWLNMPYFNSENSTRYAVYKGRGLKVDEFLDLASALQSTPEQFLDTKCTTGAQFEDGPPCLQTMLSQGEKIQPGTRNNVLFNMGVYARHKFESKTDWEAKIDEMNQELMEPPLPSREVTGMTKGLEKKEYFFTCQTPPIANFCNKALCRERPFGIGRGASTPSVSIGNLVKLCTEPPSWIIDVEGVRFELETEDLMSQVKFAKLCVDKINRWPATIKADAWKDLVTDKLANVEEIAAPQEASADGRFLWHLEQFCVVSAPARAREEMLLGKPWTDEGRHYFRSEDLFRYLNQHHVRDISTRKAWGLLRNKVGATHKQFQLKGRCVQCWSIPEFTRQTEEFETPEAKEKY